MIEELGKTSSCYASVTSVYFQDKSSILSNFLTLMKSCESGVHCTLWLGAGGSHMFVPLPPGYMGKLVRSGNLKGHSFYALEVITEMKL